mmetsp:Transcript_83223/g.230937  ORF Transcript_83223/g.230937 Transcript_83223/m.230937 type:complete len:255 (+) Transcript_83223:120-884(+)|eukprot:CAMPEP_0179069332 /NCGR_PEP_ID=MMETSP0796-20121207/30453_1 /TAXON_ID=73915 /ORGANISM="Pyrodinium bahamense, Strain pbaha01" /LENGTH=254 /DNA_ID=CAMNT_0020766395 /DNA_START=57 /DNA_END=821 /DNA_ORIENTATION=+
MPWKCKCGLQREPAGEFLADEAEFCSAGIPGPFNLGDKKWCCKCQNKSVSSYCKQCGQRARSGTGATQAHRQKVEHLDAGLCMCGRPRGHFYDPNCMIAGTVGGLSKWGEGKIPVSKWGPPFLRATKGVIKLANEDPTGLIDLWLVEREAAGDPNLKRYKKLLSAGNVESLEELFEAFANDEIVEHLQERGEQMAEHAVRRRINARLDRLNGGHRKKDKKPPRDYCGEAEKAAGRAERVADAVKEEKGDQCPTM